MKKSLKPSKPYCSCKLLKELGWTRESIRCKCKHKDLKDKNNCATISI